MKFSDGHWRLRPGVRALAPQRAHEVAVTDRGFTAVATPTATGSRTEMFDRGVLTIECSSPMADVIRVRIVHFEGERSPGPRFELRDDEPPVVVTDGEATTALTSGRITARVTKDAWRLEFLADGRPLTASERGAMAALDVDDGGGGPGRRSFVREQLSLAVGECVYGLGERFGALVKNGQSVDIWNEDGGTSTEQAYKNVPFYLTNRGYGVLVNDPGRVSFEVASENVERVQFSVPGQSLEYYVLYGPTPKDVLARYAALTGLPALPPAWSFGLWLSTSFLTDYDEASVDRLVDGMAQRRLPVHVFHFDCFWMHPLQWVDLTWDRTAFPDPRGMLARLKARGLHVCVWINPYVAQRSPLFAEGATRGFLLRRPNGDVWQTDSWQPGMAIVDFTNPDARAWFGERLRALVAMGVDSFKTDFGERIPTDVAWHDGSDPERMHNYYAYLYNRTVFDVLREARGAGEAVVFARSATVGSQRFPVHWGGDSEATYRSMAESLRGGLSLALSGFAFWSHDIGGFMSDDVGGTVEGRVARRSNDEAAEGAAADAAAEGGLMPPGVPPADVYKRWVAFGLLSSHSRLHGSTSLRVPWLFGDEAVDVLRTFTRLKCRLMPYLYAVSAETAREGVPVLRPMMLEFPDDPATEHLDRQYMLGPSLLVAPVFSAEGDVSYYVPAGRWTNVLSGTVVQGPGWQHEQHAFLSLPLLARPGAVIATGAADDRPNYDFASGVTLELYEPEDGSRTEVVVPDGHGRPDVVFAVERDGLVLTVTRHGRAVSWQLLLVNGHASSAGGGAVVRAARGALIRMAAGTARVVVTLG